MLKVFLITVLILVIGFIVFLKSSYSKVKADFNSKMEAIIPNANSFEGVFTEEDIKDLPETLQKYFNYCGFIGEPKMSYMKATFNNVNFVMQNNNSSKMLIMDYTQYNYVDQANRFALIESSMFGIPFEGIDTYENGVGSMKGVVAKLFTIFDVRGENMNKASLVTFLSESLLIPNVALQDYIEWQAMNDNQVKAKLTYYGITVEGIFTFDDNGAMTSFRTKDRVATDMNGEEKEAEWSALCSNYQENNGIMQPTVLQAVWHFPEGDLLYFDGKDIEIQYFE